MTMDKRFFKNWLGSEKGATSIEYSLIAVGVAVAIAVIVVTLGGSAAGLYTSVAAALK
jgi:Flp pilus assembly pilin Flp